jgi:hypothetical protein
MFGFEVVGRKAFEMLVARLLNRWYLLQWLDARLLNRWCLRLDARLLNRWCLRGWISGCCRGGAFLFMQTAVGLITLTAYFQYPPTTVGVWKDARMLFRLCLRCLDVRLLEVWRLRCWMPGC